MLASTPPPPPPSSSRARTPQRGTPLQSSARRKSTPVLLARQPPPPPPPSFTPAPPLSVLRSSRRRAEDVDIPTASPLLPPSSRAGSPYVEHALQQDGDAALALVTARLMAVQRENLSLARMRSVPDTLVRCLEELDRVEREWAKDKALIAQLRSELARLRSGR